MIALHLASINPRSVVQTKHAFYFSFLSRFRSRLHTFHSHQPQILPPALGVQIQVWGLAQRADAVPGTSLDVVVRSTVPHAPVVPNGEVVLAPLEADLGVVVLGDDVEEVAQDQVGLVFCDAVDALGEALVYVDGFPSRYGCKMKMLSMKKEFDGRNSKKQNSRFVRITGCTAVNASPWFNGLPLTPFRNGLPNRAASSKKNLASCVAVKPSNMVRKGGDNRS